jgi:hypothetical protein
VKSLPIFAIAVLLALAAAWAGADYLDSPPGHKGNQDSLSELWPKLYRERQRSEELQAAFHSVQERIDGKRRVVRELLDGRVTLLEAAARFHELCAASPAIIAGLHQRYPGCSSDAECYCRSLIRHAEDALADRPDRAAVLARLQAELDDHFAHGSLRRPE